MLESCCKKSHCSNSADLLCQLVHGAQKNDQNSIDKLCEMYKPLIYKVLQSSYVRRILQEDAENDAWIIFLKCIYHYKGNDFKTLPGLLKKTLLYELLKLCQKKDASAFEYLETNDERVIEISDPDDQIEQVEDRVHFQTLIDCLSKNQKTVITMYYYEQISLKEISYKLNKPYNAVYSAYRKGLRKLRKTYNVNLGKEGALRSVLFALYPKLWTLKEGEIPKYGQFSNDKVRF